MRFYDADSGSISVDSVPIDSVTRRSLRENFGMVLQDTWIMNSTVRENIRFGRPEAQDDEIIKAAEAAHCMGFIKQLPDGLDTVLNENTLSQGQRQLLCIARVMLCRPPMLILDEATSNIDTRTEVLIQRAFDELMCGLDQLCGSPQTFDRGGCIGDNSYALGTYYRERNPRAAYEKGRLLQRALQQSVFTSGVSAKSVLKPVFFDKIGL